MIPLVNIFVVARSKELLEDAFVHIMDAKPFLFPMIRGKDVVEASLVMQ